MTGTRTARRRADTKRRRAASRTTLVFVAPLVLFLVATFLTGGRSGRRDGDVDTGRWIVGITLVVTIGLISLLVLWLTRADRRIRNRYGTAAGYAGLSTRFFTPAEAANFGGRQRRVLDPTKNGAYGTILIRPDGVLWLPGPTAKWSRLPAGMWRWQDLRAAELGEVGVTRMGWLSLYPHGGEPIRLSVSRADEARDELRRLAPAPYRDDAIGWVFYPS